MTFINYTEILNSLILSMASKQEVLDQIESEMFSVDIYSQYIEALMMINLDLMDLEDSKLENYKDLVSLYLVGAIKDSEDLLTQLRNNN